MTSCFFLKLTKNHPTGLKLIEVDKTNRVWIYCILWKEKRFLPCLYVAHNAGVKSLRREFSPLIGSVIPIVTWDTVSDWLKGFIVDLCSSLTFAFNTLTSQK